MQASSNETGIMRAHFARPFLWCSIGLAMFAGAMLTSSEVES
jgi:hypothetical protein